MYVVVADCNVTAKTQGLSIIACCMILDECDCSISGVLLAAATCRSPPSLGKPITN